MREPNTETRVFLTADQYLTEEQARDIYWRYPVLDRSLRPEDVRRLVNVAAQHMLGADWLDEQQA